MTILDFITGLLPQDFWLGPPLPRSWNVRWPWLQTSESLPSLSLASESAMTTYDNVEEIELLDIDPDLLMPRKIIVHRKAKVLR